MCIPTLIVPGLNGSPEGHWQQHWLRDRVDARLVDQDNWNCLVLDEWQARLEAALDAVDDGAFIVAHSLGCVLTASLADRPSARKIKGALLVAPADLDKVEALHPCVVSFGVKPLQTLPFPSLVIGSLNDPYMDVTDLSRHVDGWGSQLVNLGAVGHINIASGFGRWEEGYAFADRLNRAPAFSFAARSVSPEEGRAAAL